MKLFIVSVLAAVASVKASGIGSHLVALAAPVAISSPVSTQYHSQDELGQYSYGYSNGQSAKAEARSLNGVTVGGYTYVDPAGKLQTVEYSSDANGFKVAASNLPVGPAVPPAPVLPLPAPVQDTPEVVEARAKHLEALEIAKVRSAEAAAAVPVISTLVQSISPVAPATLVAPIVASGPVTAPLLAAKSALAQPAQPAAAPAAELPTTAPPPIEAASTVAPAPAVEAKSASVDGAIVTPAGVSILSTPTVGLRSVIAPGLPVASVVSAPATAYTVNSVYPYGFSTLLAQPALTTYTAQYLAPVPASVTQTGEAWAPAKPAELSSE